MDINKKCRKGDRYLLPSSLTLATGLARERPVITATTSLPSFLSSPSLSFSPFTHFTHLQPDGPLGVSRFTVTATALSSRSKTAKAAWCLDTRVRVYEQQYNRGSPSVGGLTEGGRQKWSLTATAPCRVPRQFAKAAWCLDTRLRVYEQHLESGITEGAAVSEGLSKDM